jgi:hypothetical protein
LCSSANALNRSCSLCASCNRGRRAIRRAVWARGGSMLWVAWRTERRARGGGEAAHFQLLALLMEPVFGSLRKSLCLGLSNLCAKRKQAPKTARVGDSGARGISRVRNRRRGGATCVLKFALQLRHGALELLASSLEFRANFMSAWPGVRVSQAHGMPWSPLLETHAQWLACAAVADSSAAVSFKPMLLSCSPTTAVDRLTTSPPR